MNADVLEMAAEHACPRCKSVEVDKYHHQGDALAPECWYWACTDCGHQWGHG